MRVLLVDDDARIREGLAAFLIAREHVVSQAASALEARALLSEKAFDVVLSDFQMPGGTGGDLHDWVRGARLDTPFILMSGSNDGEDWARAHDVTFLAKPFSLPRLLGLIQEVRSAATRVVDEP